jgi:hypothetical protein
MLHTRNPDWLARFVHASIEGAQESVQTRAKLYHELTVDFVATLMRQSQGTMAEFLDAVNADDVTQSQDRGRARLELAITNMRHAIANSANTKLTIVRPTANFDLRSVKRHEDYKMRVNRVEAGQRFFENVMSGPTRWPLRPTSLDLGRASKSTTSDGKFKVRCTIFCFLFLLLLLYYLNIY